MYVFVCLHTVYTHTHIYIYTYILSSDNCNVYISSERKRVIPVKNPQEKGRRTGEFATRTVRENLTCFSGEGCLCVYVCVRVCGRLLVTVAMNGVRGGGNLRCVHPPSPLYTQPCLGHLRLCVQD